MYAAPQLLAACTYGAHSSAGKTPRQTYLAQQQESAGAIEAERSRQTGPCNGGIAAVTEATKYTRSQMLTKQHEMQHLYLQPAWQGEKIWLAVLRIRGAQQRLLACLPAALLMVLPGCAGVARAVQTLLACVYDRLER